MYHVLPGNLGPPLIELHGFADARPCFSWQEEADSAKDKDQSGVSTAKQVAAKALEFDEKEEAEYLKLEHAFKIRLGLISEEEG